MRGLDPLYPLPVPPSWVPGAAVGMLSLHFIQKLLFPYFWADLRYLLKVLTYGLRMEMYRLQGRVVTVLDKFVKLAEKQPQKPFLIYEGTVHTYRDVDRRSNRIAQVFLQYEALKKGDTVALLMGNEPDFIHVWFGLAKLGCVVAFLNFNVRYRSLLHCVCSCEPKILVVGAGLPKAAVISHLQILKGAAGLWAFGATSEDIIYITLPLYHSAASLLGIGGCIELEHSVLQFERTEKGVILEEKRREREERERREEKRREEKRREEREREEKRREREEKRREEKRERRREEKRREEKRREEKNPNKSREYRCSAFWYFNLNMTVF
ncbi:hypothetical protein DUI87_00604 [Hirundo rustica rustica]|uniref:Long-chain-fatty-acid--CoA ligase n=1 Tax=Hirundo rustica rustica TaxID=333673 RepID=A0A3M0L9L1_HIRRU|nr:hypothetical protein DUI87_00604 [Hirundo rustica rustica]